MHSNFVMDFLMYNTVCVTFYCLRELRPLQAPLPIVISFNRTGDHFSSTEMVRHFVFFIHDYQLNCQNRKIGMKMMVVQ